MRKVIRWLIIVVSMMITLIVGGICVYFAFSGTVM